MRHKLKSLRDFLDLPFDDIIDVRAPSEFAEDHIPGAINLPVLSDAERAQVGTIYVRQDRFLARKIGAALVSRNAADHLQGPLADRPGSWRPLVYCWRGGQRSGSFATILDLIGWRVGVIEGGYKAYRRLVMQAVYKTPIALDLILIDGGTGTAKTHLLRHLRAAGEQVLDLEALANHRGSNFGAQGTQPKQKSFESRVAMGLLQMDPARPVYLEAESNAIGDVLIPPMLWSAMKEATVIMIEAPVPARAQHLLAAYPDLVEDADLLTSRIDALRPYHARDRIEAWHGLAREGRFAALAEALIEEHYDIRYKHAARAGRQALDVFTVANLQDADLASLVPRITARISER